MNSTFLYIWLAVMLIVCLTAPIVRKKRGQPAPETQDFIVAGFALGSAIALGNVLIKLLITQKQLQADLEWDGSVALCISSGLGIYLSLKEVIKLF